MLRLSAFLYVTPLMLAIGLAGCKPSPQEGEDRSVINVAPGDVVNVPEDRNTAAQGSLVPPAPGEPGGLPDDRDPLNERAARVPTSVEASGGLIERWGLALGEGRPADAYRLWADGGERSGLSQAQFADKWRKYDELHVLVGRPQASDSQTVRVPVQIYGREREQARPFNLIGTMTLARNPAGQKGEPGQEPWVIAGEQFKAEGTVKVQPVESDTQTSTIPAAFQGNWSGSKARCGTPGDDMRLNVTADSLVFYESVGKVVAIQSASADRVQLKADFNGEGDKWTASLTLSLTDNGQGMTVDTIKRVRCT